MTSVVDYASLGTAVGEWMAREDLASYYPTFFKNVEARFNFGTDDDLRNPFPSPPLRTRDMITSDDLTLSSGTVALPADFLEVESYNALTSPTAHLEYAPGNWLDEIYADTSAANPLFVTVRGANLIVRPTTTSQIRLSYYQTIPALTVSNTTNWLILKAPNAYLYGACLEASLFIKDGNQASSMYGLMMGAIGGLMRTEKRAVAGTQPARRASGAVA